VAQFIGTPQMNIIPFAQLPASIRAACPAAARDGAIGLRPEGITVRQDDAGATHGTVDIIEALGAETLIYATTTEGAQYVARQSDRTGLKLGSQVSLDIDTAQAHWFDKQGRVVKATAAA
jgi:multiple sugar transport system ATP-binding protein